MKKIIVIQLSRMGDVINTLPFLMTMKEEDPDCHITMICYAEFTAILQNSPLIDRFLRIRSGEISKLAKFLESPSNGEYPELIEEYDVAVNLAYDVWPAKLCSLLKAKSKFGRTSSNKDEVRLLGDWMKYIFSMIHNRDYNLFSMVDLYTRSGGVKNRKVSGYLPYTQQQTNRGKDILKGNGYKGGLLIAIQLGASEALRMWEVEKFAQLGGRLKNFNKDMELVLIGSKAEAGLAETFISNADYDVINLVGKTEIIELPALLAECDLLISNDTGPSHIACAVNTTVISITFASASYTETGPYGIGHYVIQSELDCQPCIDNQKCSHMNCRKLISVEAVFAVAKEVITGSGDLEFNFPKLFLYRSTFIKNGSLIYYPVFSKSLSPNFQKGLLYRILWENAGDVGFYLEFIKEQVPGLKGSAVFKQLIETFGMELTTLKEIFSVGLAACNELISIFSKPGVTEDAISKPLNQLNIIEGFLDKREEPLSPLKHFFSFVMMDMDYLQFPQLAEEMKKKYAKLLSMTDSFLSNIQVLKKIS